MRMFGAAACLATVTLAAAVPRQAAPPAHSGVVLDNDRVRITRTIAAELAAQGPIAAVVVPLEDGATWKMGDAYWSGEGSDRRQPRDDNSPVIVVERKPVHGAEASPAGGGSKPGESPFTGMSFNPIFSNEQVNVIRARMEVGAREAFHTHASDTVVVHLSGGDIEDTANGKTVVNHWKHGDVEFETRGSSHSARNMGQAVDVVLVALKH